MEFQIDTHTAAGGRSVAFDLGAICLAAEELRAAFFQHGVTIKPDSDLGALISSGEKLKNSPRPVPIEPGREQDLWNCISLLRVSHAAKILSRLPRPDIYLKLLASGALRENDRRQSVGKNILWELEIAATIAGAGTSVTLEEPDVRIADADGPIGFGCKKLYSEKHVQHVRNVSTRMRHSWLEFRVERLG